jgi:hypothetical protein
VDTLHFCEAAQENWMAKRRLIAESTFFTRFGLVARTLAQCRKTAAITLAKTPRHPVEQINRGMSQSGTVLRFVSQDV